MAKTSIGRILIILGCTMLLHGHSVIACSIIPEKCDIQRPFICNNWYVNWHVEESSLLYMQLQNSESRSITISGLTVIPNPDEGYSILCDIMQVYDGTDWISPDSSPILNPGSEIELRVSCPELKEKMMAVDNRWDSQLFYFDVRIDYSTDNKALQSQGEVVAKYTSPEQKKRHKINIVLNVLFYLLIPAIICIVTFKVNKLREYKWPVIVFANLIYVFIALYYLFGNMCGPSIIRFV